jgi:hypothetical protein
MEAKPVFDIDFAQKLVGTYVLMGITYVSNTGAHIERVQKHGIVEYVDPQKGVRVALKGPYSGQYLWLPPDLRSIQVANPGEYKLKATNEVITDPDYVSTWTITKPNEQVGGD